MSLDPDRYQADQPVLGRYWNTILILESERNESNRSPAKVETEFRDLRLRGFILDAD